MRSKNDRPRRFVAGRSAAVSVLLLTAWSLVGCYALVPVTTATPVTDSRTVRVVLTAAGTVSLQQALGSNVKEIEGIVTRSNADTLIFAVAETLTGANQRFVSHGDTVAVARPLVESMSVQQYSRKRSIGLVLGIALLVVLTIVGITTGTSGVSGTGQPAPPQP